MSQIVDTETAKEFMKETLEKIDEQHLVKISDALALKSHQFKQRFDPSTIDQISEKELSETLRLVFSFRRKFKNVLEETGHSNFKNNIKDLLYGGDPINVRFQNFCDNLDTLEEHIRYDLAGELLHFTFPDKYWLWCHWMWNPKINTGSLPLVTTDDFDLRAPTLGEAYLNVGRAVAFVHTVGEAAGFQTISRSLFGTDVYLSCVYIIYAYTVLRMRMTQEFNQVMPGVAEFSRRILGVYRITDSST
jgi:hypothetical protein